MAGPGGASVKYVDLEGRDGEITGILDPGPCLAKLPEPAEQLPPGARAFATDAGFEGAVRSWPRLVG